MQGSQYEVDQVPEVNPLTNFSTPLSGCCRKKKPHILLVSEEENKDKTPGLPLNGRQVSLSAHLSVEFCTVSMSRSQVTCLHGCKITFTINITYKYVLRMQLLQHQPISFRLQIFQSRN
jgi:hypothetical protein